MPEKKYDIAIIGSGPAGMTAAIYSARKSLKTLIIGKDMGGQLAKSGEVENYTGFGQSTGAELTKAFHDHLERFDNIEHVHGYLVKNIKKDKAGFITEIENSDQYQSDALIIASGRNPRELGVPGEKEFKNKGVSYCETCDAPLFKDKTTAVIGAGNSGLEAVISLAKICPKVYLLNVKSELGGDKVLQDKVKALKNVEILNEVKPTEIVGDEFVTSMKYAEIKTKEIKEIKLEGVFIEIGWIPSIDFDQLTEKNDKNEIIIDKQGRTSAEGIFAGGDITDTGYWQVIIAAGEGAKAALSAHQYLNKQK